MKVTCIQMQTPFRRPEENFQKAEQAIAQAMEQRPDVILLPETWNTGFYPKADVAEYADQDSRQVTQRIGELARKYAVNIVAGSVSNVKGGKVYNTATVFDRTGACVASYDKIHLFTPMKEEDFYAAGDKLCRFTLDGVQCGLIVCYDLRFPELTRSLAVQGLDVLFMVSQWPTTRARHLQILTAARAIENQIFLVCCNACGPEGRDIYCGNSVAVDPWGETLALADRTEQTITAELDLTILDQIRSSIPVFRDRRPDVYKV